VRGLTAELEALAVDMYARGLSTRDIEALFADGAGHSLLSRSAVNEITERLWAFLRFRDRPAQSGGSTRRHPQRRTEEGRVSLIFIR
jgi:hypothetical protein